MKKIAFCGGGSAGHVIPNIAIKEALPSRYNVVYIGTHGIEKDICTQNQIPFYEFNGVKLVRGKLLCNLSIPLKLYKSVNQCRQILLKIKPDLLFCKGGYASLPPAIAASKLKIPIVIHESDISMGLANRLIARKASLILTSFPQTAKKYSDAVYCGSPMRSVLFNKSPVEARKKLGIDLRPTILVLGGGSGSLIINDAVRKNILKLCDKYNVIHICGKGNLIKCKIYGYIQFEFCNDMGDLYSAADYAISRCGSNTAFELIAHKIPTLFIPLNNGATRGDQMQNAKYFFNKGLCNILDEKNLSAKTLFEETEKLINCQKIKTALQQDDTQCGTENIINSINSILK